MWSARQWRGPLKFLHRRWKLKNKDSCFLFRVMLSSPSASRDAPVIVLTCIISSRVHNKMVTLQIWHFIHKIDSGYSLRKSANTILDLETETIHANKTQLKKDLNTYLLQEDSLSVLCKSTSVSSKEMLPKFDIFSSLSQSNLTSSSVLMLCLASPLVQDL